MKENENKELERLVDKAMKNMPLETPSFDFTDRVMAQTAIIPKKVSIAYKPLLPKAFWILLLAGIAVLLGYAYFAQTPQDTVSYAADWSETYSSSLQGIAKLLDFSKTTMYASVALLLAILAQIPIVRSRFAKQG